MFPMLGIVGQAGRLQKPLRLGHSHASMAAALALHGFAGRRLSPAVGVRGSPFGAGARGIPPPPYSKKHLFPAKQSIVII